MSTAAGSTTSYLPRPGQVGTLTVTGPWERWFLNWHGHDLPDFGTLRVTVARIAGPWIEFRPDVKDGPFAFLCRVRQHAAQFVPDFP